MKQKDTLDFVWIKSRQVGMTGLFAQIQANGNTYYYNEKAFNKKWLQQIMRGFITNNNTTAYKNRVNALAINRKKRWSDEVRAKMLAKKKEEYYERQRDLLSKNEI